MVSMFSAPNDPKEVDLEKEAERLARMESTASMDQGVPSWDDAKPSLNARPSQRASNVSVMTTAGVIAHDDGEEWLHRLHFVDLQQERAPCCLSSTTRGGRRWAGTTTTRSRLTPPPTR